MERGGQEKDLGIPNYTAQQIIQGSSPLRLPLAPIFSTPPDRIRGNALASTRRRGVSIFSPTQTLDPPQHPRQLSPLPPVEKETTSDPDPPTPTTTVGSNLKIPPPPPPPPPQPSSVAGTGNSPIIRYKECLKNHAASMGGHIVDGCGEFMPGGDEGLEALRCAACDCHRNFHRKEINSGGAQQPRHNNMSRLQTQTPATHLKRSHSFATTGRGSATPLNIACNSSGAAAESSSEDLNTFRHDQQSKKRFRTKFSQDQKDRMHEFASKIGWRIQKKDDEEVKQFCSEVGVQRQVFKVWMHNIKQAMKKKESDT